MASDAQLNANRANSQKSTGPKSDAGKARSSQNSLRNGLYTDHHVILPDEDGEQFEALLESLRAEFLPRTPAERYIVRSMAEAQWRLARVGRYEQRALEAAGPDPDPDLLLKYDRLTNSAQRAWRKALDSLHLLRRVRKDAPLFLVPNEKIEETNPIPKIDHEARDAVFPPPPAPVDPLPDTRPRKLPYELGMELKQLKRFHPHFDPRRSRANMSPELKAFLKDRKNLQLVLNAMVFL